MFWREILTGIGTGLAVIALVYYLYETIQKRVFPHAFSWLMWGTTALVSYLAQLTESTGIGAFITLSIAIESFLIGIFAFLYNKSTTFSYGDWATLLASFVAVILWVFTSSPLCAVIIITIANSLGYYPTLRKSYFFPNEDMPAVFLLSSIKFAISLLTFHDYTVVNALFPATTALLDVSVVCMLMIRRRQLKNLNT